MPILALGLSHRSAPVELRERFAFAESIIPTTLQQLRDSGIASEAVILSTCNRVEIYAATDLPETEALSALQRFLMNCRGYQGPPNNGFYLHGEPKSLEHLFRVACGLDSMVLGETEILGQLKKAYDLALQHKHTGGRLNKAFQKAFNVAKHIRTETNIQRGSISVASVAVELAERIFSTLQSHHVMVIGAGDTSEKAARALLSRGAQSLVVTNRSFEKAQALAELLGGRAAPFDQWEKEFDTVDIVVSSTSAPHYVLEHHQVEAFMKRRNNRPLLLIDIAVPRDIDPDVNLLENVYLYNVDHLQEIAAAYLKQREEEVAHCEAIIRERVKELIQAAQYRGKPAPQT